MFSIETKPGLSAPVTIGRKGGEASGSVQSPKQQEQHLVDNERARHSTETETDRIPPAKRPESSYRAQVIASRSLSSGSSVSGSASSDTTDSSMATDATSRASEVPAEDEDEKSSGHTVAEQRQSSSERVSTLQLAGAETRHSDSTRPTPSTLTASPTSGCEVSFLQQNMA